MINDKYKLSDVAKDLGVDQKEIIDLLEKNFSGEKKRTTALTGEELNFIFETYTQKTELKSLESYYLYKEQSGSAPAEAAKKPRLQKLRRNRRLQNSQSRKKLLKRIRRKQRQNSQNQKKNQLRQYRSRQKLYRKNLWQSQNSRRLKSRHRRLRQTMRGRSRI